MVDTQRPGRHRPKSQEKLRTSARHNRARLKATIVVACVAMAIVATFAFYDARHPVQAVHSAPHRQGLPTTPGSYIGLYPHGVPNSYAPVKAFTTATGVKPNVVVYYSGWLEPFQVNFATAAAHDGAVPLVQINPTGTSLAAIAAGRYDSYLSNFARAVRAYHHPVILSFGHEMNGYWYSWGYTHTSPVVFVAAWRHIVTLFRSRASPKCDLVVDDQHYSQARQGSVPSSLVARQLLCDLGGDRRLLHQLVVGVHFGVRTDHRLRA